jgi:hypothetical protein
MFPVAWLLFFGALSWGGLVLSVAAGLRELFSGRLLSLYQLHLAKVYLGSASPFWATLVRVVWGVVVVIGGGIVGFRGLLNVRFLRDHEAVVFGGTLGVICLGLLTLVSTQVVDVVRFFIYYPPFAVMSLLTLMTNAASNVKATVAKALALFLFVTGLPAFFANNNTISFDIRDFPQERVAGEFLRRSFDSGAGLRIFGANIFDFVYYVPFADFRIFSHAFGDADSGVVVSKSIDEEVMRFSRTSGGLGSPPLWAFTKRTAVEVYLWTGVDVERSGEWRSLEITLDTRASKVYANGDVTFYFL